MTFPLVRIGFFWQFWNLSTNSWFIYSKLHALQYLFVTRSKEEQEKDRIISNFTKIEIFSISQPNVGGNLTMRSPMLHFLKKAFLSPSVWPGREYTWRFIWKKSFKKGLPSPFSSFRKIITMGTHLKEELTDLFWKLPGYYIFPQKEQEENGEHFVND